MKLSANEKIQNENETSESLCPGSLTGPGHVRLVGREGKKHTGFHVGMAAPWGLRLGERRKRTEG